MDTQKTDDTELSEDCYPQPIALTRMPLAEILVEVQKRLQEAKLRELNLGGDK